MHARGGTGLSRSQPRIHDDQGPRLGVAWWTDQVKSGAPTDQKWTGQALAKAFTLIPGARKASQTRLNETNITNHIIYHTTSHHIVS